MNKKSLCLSIALAGNALLAVQAAHAQTMNTLHGFAGTPDGAGPQGGLISHDGFLYGTTASGGAYGMGALFKLDPVSGAETVLYSFADTDGQSPMGQLLYLGGYLYGTTEFGGTYGYGTLFRFDLATGKETVLYSFQFDPAASAGWWPQGRLIYAGGDLYGTTAQGGAPGGAGAVFKFNLKTRELSGLYSFRGNFGVPADGGSPSPDLVFDGTALYGSTYGAGEFGNGIVFKIDPTTGAETILHNFGRWPDAAYPNSLSLHDGILYGSAFGGGLSNAGAIFQVNTTSGDERVIYSFKGGSDGATPFGELLYRDGYLYGTTQSGGASANGTLFKLRLSWPKNTVLHDFDGVTDGAQPSGPLLWLNGALFGTTPAGGASNGGTAFSFTP